MAVESFKNKATEAINSGENNKQTQKLLPNELHRKAQIKLAILGAATILNDLMELRGNRFEALKGNHKGQSSIRINDQYRICFEWRNNDAFEVEIQTITINGENYELHNTDSSRISLAG